MEKKDEIVVAYERGKKRITKNLCKNLHQKKKKSLDLTWKTNLKKKKREARYGRKILMAREVWHNLSKFKVEKEVVFEEQWEIEAWKRKKARTIKILAKLGG